MKRKPFSKVDNARHMRHEQRTYDSVIKYFKKNGISLEPWQRRLMKEDHDLFVKTYRLKDFLWITERADEEDFSSYSPEALGLGRRYCQLLARQYKAMCKYLAILDARINLMGPVGKVPRKGSRGKAR